MIKSRHVIEAYCWGQGRQCGIKSNTLCEEEPAYERKARYAERERERERGIGTKRRFIPKGNSYKKNNNNIALLSYFTSFLEP